MEKQLIKKAVAGMLAFIIGISIVMTTLIPLMIYLNTSGGETLKAMAIEREFQNQRSREALDVIYDNTSQSFLIKNTGTTPITIIVAAINGGNNCENLLKTNITLNPGESIKNISSYGPGNICYVVTSRGNVFPVKEKYSLLSSQLLQSLQEIIFTPNNTAFAEDLNSFYSIEAKYNTNGYTCTNPGDPELYNFGGYSRALLTIADSGDPVEYGGGGNRVGCFNLVFQNAVNVSGNNYAVAVFYKIVIVFTHKGNKLSAALSICLQGQGGETRCASASETSWIPNSIQANYVVLEGLTLIQMRNAPAGLYSLNLTLISNSQGNTRFNVGVEYIAVQNARLVTG